MKKHLPSFIRRFIVICIILGVVVTGGSGTQISQARNRAITPERAVQVGTLLYSQVGGTNNQIRSSNDTVMGISFTQAADDFVVSSSRTIYSVVAYGQNGENGALFDVTIWSNAAAQPGVALCIAANQTNVGTTSNPIINLSTPCGLSAGVYWLSIQHRGTTSTGWFWNNTTLGIFNSPAVWRVPGNTVGCVTNWTPLSGALGCSPSQNPPDRQFALYGAFGANPQPLIASAGCIGARLNVTISAGDGPFNITASAGINTPVNGVGIGTTAINGPEKWDDLNVTETNDDLQSVNLGMFKCRSGARPVPLYPAHQSHTTSAFPLFSWTGISIANNYRVFVYDDANPASRTVDIRQNSGGPTSMQLSTPLPDGRLFWRVRGRQNRLWSLWSVRFTLFKDPAPPLTITTPVPTIDLNPRSGGDSVPTPVPTFPPPPNTR
ncbi:MAG: hypothetical protein L0154_20525 [Chloroflexi bacterium]|nr:hypothetical protein [Chloroflexota bacterium]